MKREEKKLSRLSYDKLIELFSGRKNLHFICNEFFLDNCFHCHSKADATLSSRGKVTRLPSVNSSIHACMQKMKEALKLISRPLRHIVYRRLLRRRSIFQSVFFVFARKIAPRVQWSEAWGNFQDSEIETRFTANYWLKERSRQRKTKPVQRFFVRSPRLRFAHATTTKAEAEAKKCLQLDVRQRKLEMPLTKCVWWLRTDAKSSPFAEFR